MKISSVNALFLDKLGTNVVDFYSVNPSRFEFHSIALSIKSPKESSDSHDDGSIHIDKAEMWNHMLKIPRATKYWQYFDNLLLEFDWFF